MTGTPSPESIFSGTESLDEKGDRLKANPRVARMAKFYAELKALEWGYSEITTVGLPIEGTDIVHQTELTPEEVSELEPQARAALTRYCEGDEGVATVLFGQAHQQLVEVMESGNPAES